MKRTTTRHFPMILTLLAAGCGGAAVESAEEAPALDIAVPAIEGAVERERFCEVFQQIECAANVGGCCTDPQGRAPSAEACVSTPDCSALLDHALVRDGLLQYDPMVAGDFLRAGARNAAACSLDADWRHLSFLEGKRVEGEDCSPVGGDSTYLRLCEPGLRCAVRQDEAGAPVGSCVQMPALPALRGLGERCEDEDGSACNSGRCVDGVCAERLEEGSTCRLDADCVSGRCTNGEAEPDCADGSCGCAPVGDAFCQLEEPLPQRPTNTSTYTNPSSLCVQAHESDNSGTNGDLTLKFFVDNKYYSCTITETVSDGEEACCTPSYGGSANSAYNNQMKVMMWNDDGIRITALKVKSGANTWTLGTFDDDNLGTEMDCEGCNFWSKNCNSCWLDQDGHGSCRHMVFDFDDQGTQCIATN